MRTGAGPADESVAEGVEVLMERPVDAGRLCLIKSGTRVPRLSLELWVRTRRRKSPWDRCRVGEVSGDGIRALASVNKRAAPHMARIRELIPEFEPTAAVAAVNLS